MNFENLNKRLCGNPIVSRETFERLDVYAKELKRWNPKINLVAPSTIHELWDRHIVDSLQIARFLPPKITNWVDIGSGGGFPGLVLAAHLADHTDFMMTLIESDQRKCAFLRTCARNMGVKVNVISERIESVNMSSVDVITARALASLSKLMELTENIAQEQTQFIFPKGKNWESELTLAREYWQMNVETHQSITDPEAKILLLKEVSPNVPS